MCTVIIIVLLVARGFSTLVVSHVQKLQIARSLGYAQMSEVANLNEVAQYRTSHFRTVLTLLAAVCGFVCHIMPKVFT